MYLLYIFPIFLETFLKYKISLPLSLSYFLCFTIAVSFPKSHCLCLYDLCPAARRHVFVLDTRPLTSQARSVTPRRGFWRNESTSRRNRSRFLSWASPRSRFNVDQFWVSVKRENASSSPQWRELHWINH